MMSGYVVYYVYILTTLNNFFTNAEVHIAANQTILLANIGDRGYIQSSNFPVRCCTSQQITLQLGVNAAQANAYIHFVFNDLDLGTNFKIYKQADTLPYNMFEDQPTYKHGMWRRPFITSTRDGQIIHLVLHPPHSHYNQSFYAGFRASYMVKKDQSPIYKMTSELCPPIASVIEGDIVVVKPQPIARYHDLKLDCVWHIKTPDGGLTIPGNEQDQFRTYIRILEANLPGGRIEIHRGWTSTSVEIAKGKTLAELRQPEEGFTAQQGFYMHLHMPADDRPNKFSFVYGVIHHLASERVGQCDVGYQCPDKLNWCIPSNNVCNGVDNCPGGADETECDKSVITRTPVTTSVIITSTTTPKPCRTDYLHQCYDGRCVLFKSDCDTNIGKGDCTYTSKYCPDDGSCVFRFDSCPGECPSYKKKCQDGSCVSSHEYCVEDSCMSASETKCDDGKDCYSEYDECDSYQDCHDGTDERGCSAWSSMDDNSKLYFLIVIPVVIITCAIACYKCCRQRSNEHTSPDPPRTVPHVFGGTQMHPVRPTDNSTNNQHGYTAVSTDAQIELTQLETHDTPQPVEPSAPPAYEEVVSTDIYTPGTGSGEPPPPSYASAIQGEQIHIL